MHTVRCRGAGSIAHDMNNKEFVAALSLKENYKLRDTRMLIQHLLAELTAQFEEENSVLVPNFGSFEVKKRMERVINNPTTGQRLLVPPRLTLTFKSSAALRERTKEGGEEA